MLEIQCEVVVFFLRSFRSPFSGQRSSFFNPRSEFCNPCIHRYSSDGRKYSYICETWVKQVDLKEVSRNLFILLRQNMALTGLWKGHFSRRLAPCLQPLSCLDISLSPTLPNVYKFLARPSLFLGTLFSTYCYHS